MSQLYFIGIGLLLALAAGAGFWFYRRRRQAHAAAEILNDPNPIASWTYTPQEWQQAVSDEFSWASAHGDSAQIRICQNGFYVWSDSHSRVYDLEAGGKFVTFAGYLGVEGNPLKLRVRWREITRDRNGNEEIHYYKKDYRIPVPMREKEAATKVVEFFTTRLEKHLDWYTALLPEDEPISLFGKDSF
jgi:LPXTG-motif cell wall-anchored protein